MIVAVVLEQITATNTGFVLPEDAVLALGGGRRPKVEVTVEGVTWRTSVAPMGGRFLLGLTKAQKAATGVEVGRTYDVRIEADVVERTVEVPEDLAAALASDAGRAEAWERWSYTRRKEAARSLTEAKQAATRERRLSKVLADLG